jgi:UDP-N-acetyl-2-amino-2-deoxyglucuronate dehydrogenase
MSEPQVEHPAEMWAVWRIDDNANVFVVREHLTQEEADRVVAEFTARGHKQTYWAEREGVRAD